MKLNQKIARIQITTLFIIVPITGIVMFFGLRYFLEQEIDEKLLNDELIVSKLIAENDLLSSLNPFLDYKVVSDSVHESRVFGKQYIKDPVGGGKELYRVLTTVKRIKNVNYSIIVKQSIVETKDFLYIIFMSIGVFLIVTVSGFQLIYWNLQVKIWTPFFKSLDLIKSLSIKDYPAVKFDNAEIEEFNAMNMQINFMAAKMALDYKKLKEFSENASHETQTPLAIMILELEEIMQTELPQEMSKKIYKVFQAANRLSSLNDKLFLLSKIDNQEFSNLEELNVTELVLSEIKKVDLILKQKNLIVLDRIHGEFKYKSDSFAMSILISNLLSNAINHNYENGYIEIYSVKNSIRISNSFKNDVDLDRIFERFYKDNSSKNSHGLGLSISKRIAQISNLSLTVDINEGEIFFTIKPLEVIKP